MMCSRFLANPYCLFHTALPLSLQGKRLDLQVSYMSANLACSGGKLPDVSLRPSPEGPLLNVLLSLEGFIAC